MDTREIFKKAFSDIQNTNSFPAHEKAYNDVLERAKRMKTQNEIAGIYGSKMYGAPAAKKHSRIFTAAAWIAGSAVVLAGAVFGLKFLADHGGLKGPDVSSGSGYSAASETTMETEVTDISGNPPESGNMEDANDAKLIELKYLKAYYEQELEVYESEKEETALELASLGQSREKLVAELERQRSLGEDTGSVEQKIKSAEDKISEQETMLESYSSKCEQTYDKLAAVKLEISKIEAEMQKYEFIEFGSKDTAESGGWYEGEEALDILKQYAGEDYCFPLEDWTKDVINYRTHDEWTGDTSTDYRFNIPAEDGEPILAVTSGTVIETNSRNVPGQGEGIYITIQAADGRKWRYSHLSDYYVSEGDIVKAGDRIAAVGATGWCTGPLVCISFPDSEVIDPAAGQ